MSYLLVPPRKNTGAVDGQGIYSIFIVYLICLYRKVIVQTTIYTRHAPRLSRLAGVSHVVSCVPGWSIRHHRMHPTLPIALPVFAPACDKIPQESSSDTEDLGLLDPTSLFVIPYSSNLLSATLSITYIGHNLSYYICVSKLLRR